MADTKTCNLTETEIMILLAYHGKILGSPIDDIEQNMDYRVERINYLNKRLKAFKEPETETKPAAPVAAGWGTPTT